MDKLKAFFPEIFWLVSFSALIIAISYSFKEGLQLSISTTIMICFIIELVFSHMWFVFFGKRVHDHRLPKLIDYVYLSAAAVGLLSSVIEYEQKAIEGQAISNIVSWDQTASVSVADLEAKTHDDCKQIGKISRAECLALIDKLQKFRLATPMFGTPYELQVSWFQVRRNIFDKLKKYLQDKDAVDMFGVFAETDKTRIIAYFSKIEILGYLLVAAAAALRITKVTVEIWELHKDKPK